MGPPAGWGCAFPGGGRRRGRRGLGGRCGRRGRRGRRLDRAAQPGPTGLGATCPRRRRARRGGPRRRRLTAGRALQLLDAGQQRRWGGVRAGVGELDQGDVEQDARVGRVAELDQHLAEDLHGPDRRREPQPVRLVPHHVTPAVRELDEVRRNHREEGLAKVGDEVLGQAPRIPPALHRGGESGQRPAGVGLHQAFDEVVEREQLRRDAAGGHHLVERGQRVPRRTGPHVQHGLDGLVGDLQAGVGGHPPDMGLQLLGREQVELQVLGAAADGRAHLLRIGGGEHEHHVWRRLLERLQQRRLGRPGQHVHLVEDVDLVAAGRGVRGALDQLADVLDAVVAGGVELVDVEARAGVDRQAGWTHATGLAVGRRLAVEHLGQDAGRGRLARPPRPTEQIGVADPVLPNGVAEHPDDVLLAP